MDVRTRSVVPSVGRGFDVPDDVSGETVRASRFLPPTSALTRLLFQRRPFRMQSREEYCDIRFSARSPHQRSSTAKVSGSQSTKNVE